MYKTIIAAAAALFSISDAYAWETFVEGPDVFGATKAMATEGTQRDSIVIQCDSKGMLALAYIMRKKEFEEVSETTATLYIRTSSDATPAKLEATLREWNDNYGGVVVSGVTPETLAVIRAIGDAKGKIGIGFEARGNQWSAEFSSRGSTKSMSKLLKACDLENEGLPPA